MGKHTKKLSNSGFLIIADFSRSGGAKNMFLQVLDYLLAKSWPVTVIVHSESVLTQEDKLWLKSNEVKVKYLPGILARRNSFFSFLRLYPFLQFVYFISIKGSFEKVIASIEQPYSMLVSAWVWGKRLIYIQHTYPQGIPSGLTRLVVPLRRVYYRLMATRAYRFVMASKASKAILLAQFGLQDKHLPIQVIPNGKNVELETKCSGNEPMVLTLGHLEKWKNPFFWLELAILCCQKDSEISFIWAGDGPLKEECQAGIPAEYSQRIKFIGQQGSVAELLCRAVIYFQPSLIENHSVAVVEALANSLPCIVSNHGGLPEMVDHGESGYIVDLEVNNTAEKILELIQDEKLRKRMGTSARLKYERAFSYNRWAKSMNKILFED